MLVFGILLLLVVAIRVIMLIYRLRKAKSSSPRQKVFSAAEQTTPDLPQGFGYKCTWIAVKANDPQKVAECLKLRNISACNWAAGISKAYDDSVFISPPLGGWIIAAGVNLPAPESTNDIHEVKKMLAALSLVFGEAQLFSTHRVVEYHCWIKAAAGAVTRIYAFSGEAGENIAIEGRPTRIENQYQLVNTFSEESDQDNYFDRDDLTWPDEELVMKIAADWSIDPTKLDELKDMQPTLGLVGQL
ncbi:MAG: hypothetical protein JWO09_3881 [Bacteroidetes bacterium]|nr:hypothetical protein [Bacteroidota bacterium]